MRVWRARVLMWSGNLAGAETEYLWIVRVAGNDPDNWMGLASAYLRESRTQEALRAMNCAVEQDPKRDDLRAARGRALRAAGKRSEAPKSAAPEPGEAIAALLHGLTDSNRLVRFRSAEGLVQREREMVSIFGRVVAMRDLYGIHAYLTALENSSMRETLEAELKEAREIREQEQRQLLDVLKSWKLPENEDALAIPVVLQTVLRP